MRALVASELLKVWTTRTRWAYIGVVSLLCGLGVAGEIGSSTSADRSLLEHQLTLIDTTGAAALLALILGITVITSEFRHGTITPTLLAEPRRERVLVSKAIATAVLAVLLDLLALVVVYAVALPWLSLVDAELHLFGGDAGTRVAQSFLASVLWALMGLAIGSVVHSQVAALVGALVWMFIVENVVSALFAWMDIGDAARYFPFRALNAAGGANGDGALSYWPAVAVSVAWVAAIGAAGIARTLRRDIT